MSASMVQKRCACPVGPAPQSLRLEDGTQFLNCGVVAPDTEGKPIVGFALVGSPTVVKNPHCTNCTSGTNQQVVSRVKMVVINPEDEIHIWLIDITRLEDLRQVADQNYLFSSILGDAERKELISNREKSHERFLVRGAAQKLILQAYTGIAAKDIVLERTPNGEKPILRRFQNLRNISFNVSHAGDFVAIAVSLGDQLGVDLEQTTRKISDSKISQLSRAYFSEEENTLVVDSENIEERRNRFFMIWTIKEAMLKATGEGFRRSPKSFSILLEDRGEEETKIHSSSAWASRFNFETFYSAPSLVGAVAYVKCNSSRKKLVYKSFSVDCLAYADPLCH